MAAEPAPASTPVIEIPNDGDPQLPLTEADAPYEEQAAAPDPAGPSDDKLARYLALCRTGNIETVRDIAKAAYAQLARLEREAIPHAEEFEAATLALQETLRARNAKLLPDDEFEIQLVERKSAPIRNDDLLYTLLHELRIDGQPLPAELLAKAAFEFQPPPVRKTDLNAVRALEKIYGTSVADARARAIQPQPSRWSLSFEPKKES